jgi:2-methylisocitrate lyase-like PEP mutase family enzyme
MTALSQYEKAIVFQDLHKRPAIFVVPNPWDVGSAKILTQQGYCALATTSAGLAYSLGKADGTQEITRIEALENSKAIVSATHLPVIADLENGYGDAPETCAETIRLAAEVGLIGGSIEDSNGCVGDPIYEFNVAVARIRAAVTAARKLPFHFTLTARAENYLHGICDIDDTIKRLVAFAEAGADVLFAPGVKSKDDIVKIVKAVAPLPVNVLWGYPDVDLTISDLSNLGVKRVSLGSSFARMAYGNLINAGNEVRRKGTAHYAKQAMAYTDMNAFFKSMNQ